MPLTPSSERLARACAALQTVVCLAAFALLAWRAALPNAQHRDTDQAGLPGPGELWTQEGDGYDDVVTVVTARNFARHGFLRTHLLPDRGGAPLASFLDFGRSQCRSVAPGPGSPRYRDPMGDGVDMVSLNGQCIYTHYPPLADWVFGAMASAGLDCILDYRLLAIAVSCATLALLFLWLRREVHPAAALAAVFLIAISPAFFRWAAALFHVSFQYLFFAAGLLCWSRFLETRRRRWFVLTWAAFLCEALTSVELVAFFAIVVVGLVLLDGGGEGRTRRLGWIAVQATAPVAAVLLHLALRASLLGAAATWRDLVETATARAGFGWSAWRLEVWVDRIQTQLLRADLAAIALAVAVAARRAARARPWRALALAGILLAGGLSFLALFPGTTLLHGWMMYRHLLPLTALLLALAVDAGLLLPDLWRRGAGSGRAVRALGLAAAASALAVTQWSLHRSALDIARDVRWSREANAHHDPRNQGVRFLDVLHWTEQGPTTYELRSLLAVDGRRVNAPPSPVTVFLLSASVLQHTEIWWLDEVDLSSVELLSEDPFAQLLPGRCALSLFDGSDFRPAWLTTHATFEPFVPDASEPPAPGYRWLRVPVQGRTRAIRLSCAGLPTPVPLHEVEVH